MQPEMAESPRSETRPRKVMLGLLLLWLPFFALWTLFNGIYGGIGWADAAYGSALSMGWAAMLGAGVWWLSGRYPWPDRVGVWFYAAQLAAGVTYSALWILRGYIHFALETDRSVLAVMRESETLGWQFVMGLWLYGLVAGICHGVRTRRKLGDKERAWARAEALAARAQMQALRAQLQPHFLFNALHSVAALIRHDPDAAEKAVERLGDLLRYALDQRGDERVRLEDEWSFTRHYLALERLRFGDRLDVHEDLDARALDVRVPPFSLQPLVENAIRHGIAPRPGPGRLCISARYINEQPGDRLMIEVRDDGLGCDLDRAPPSDSGHGLSTLRKRCAAYYGDRATLVLESSAGAGFSARLTLPVDVGRDTGSGPDLIPDAFVAEDGR